MKKVKILLTCILACSTMLVESCTKELVTTDTMTGSLGFDVRLSTTSLSKKTDKDTWLVFPSVEDYNKAVDYFVELCDTYDNPELFENLLNYTSMRKSLSINDREKINIDDDVLALILNPYGKVQIENYILTVDMVEGKLFVENTNNPDDSFYMSTEDSFIDYLEGNITREELANNMTAMKSTRHDSYEVTRPLCDAPDKTITIEAIAKNTGIFHYIKAKISRNITYIGSAPTMMGVETLAGGYFIYKSTGTRIGIPQEYKGGYDHKKYMIRPLYSTRSFYISNYKFNVRFYYTTSIVPEETALLEVSIPYYL